VATRPHQQLVEAVLVELSSWNPREFIAHFRRWQQGSFSLIHLNVLTLLETEGPLSMSHLAEELDVSVASMTGIVDRMVNRGLVERGDDPNDRRIVLVHPTAAGARIFEEIDERRRERLGEMLVRLTDKELIGLLKGHRALRAARSALGPSTAADPGAIATPGAAGRLVRAAAPPARPTGGTRR
jgi:DNA-binding MarR family transcriptional regulator